MRDLFTMAVEEKRRAAAQLTDPPLIGLAPAWVIDLGVHIRIEPVFMGATLRRAAATHQLSESAPPQ